MSEMKNAPITHQPRKQEPPSFRTVTGTEEWSNGTFSCLAGGCAANNYICLQTFFSPCITYGRQRERLRNPSLEGYNKANESCGGYLLLCGLHCILDFQNRREIRARYNIKGTKMSDCLTSTFCGCCTLIQQEREIILRQAAVGNQQGYVRPEDMTV